MIRFGSVSDLARPNFGDVSETAQQIVFTDYFPIGIVHVQFEELNTKQMHELKCFPFTSINYVNLPDYYA